MEHIISVLVENKFGVLARVAGLFSARGYNIESLSVAPTLDPTTSMITIVTVGDDRIIEQIMKQLNKVVEVLKVVDLTETDFLDRETALIKVHTKPEHRDEAIRITDIFRAKIVDVSEKEHSPPSVSVREYAKRKTRKHQGYGHDPDRDSHPEVGKALDFRQEEREVCVDETKHDAGDEAEVDEEAGLPRYAPILAED